MPIGNICNGISFRHDDSVLRSFSGAVCCCQVPGDLVLATMGVLVELSTDSYNNYAGFRMWFQASGGTQPTTSTETHTTGQLIVLLPTPNYILKDILNV